MTTINISSRPTIDESLGTVTQRVFSFNKTTGKSEFIDISLEESRFKTVSKDTINQINDDITVIQNIANNVTLSLIVEDLKSSIENGKLNYSLSSKFKEGSLCVYVNGLQVSTDVVELEDRTGFSLNSDYSSIIDTEDTSIIASYVKDI